MRQRHDSADEPVAVNDHPRLARTEGRGGHMNGRRRKESTLEQHDRTEAVCDACRRIPVTHLALDIDEPLEGWPSFLAERRVQVFDDALGRPSISRHALRDLIDERREGEARLAAEQAEKAAVAARRPPVAVGVPAIEGGSAIESMMAAPGYTSLHAELGRPKPNFLDEMLAEGQRQQAAVRAESEAVDQARKVLEGKEVKKR
jgi:hypothetical protein